jgi:hypothetical protein
MSKILDHLKLKYYKVHDVLALDVPYLLEQNLDELYIDVFSEGVDSLFSELKKNQPLTFQKLKECTGLYLLERERLGNKGGNYFEVALTYSNGLVTTNFMNIRSYKRRTLKNLVPAKLVHIPKELRCYYDFCDGLNIPSDNNPAGIMNYILPGAPTTFDDVSSLISEYSLDKSYFADFLNKGKNIFVWCRDPKKEYVLIEKESHKIYVVDYKKKGEYKLLNNQTKEVDSLFSQLIKKNCID